MDTIRCLNLPGPIETWEDQRTEKISECVGRRT
jgi:hypothetical protein